MATDEKTEGQAKAQAEEYERGVFRKMLEDKYGKVWDTAELQQDFTVRGFCAGFVVAIRDSDGQQGSLDFTHSPRFYHSFVKG